MIMSFLIDILIVGLLAYAIFIARKLQKQFTAFKQNKDAFLAAVGDLDRSIMQADRAIAGLQNSAGEVGAKLQSEIKEAQALFDELHFINDAGNNLATRLEKLAGQANPVKDREAETQEKSKKSKKSDTIKKETLKTGSRAEEELLKAIKSKKAEQQSTKTTGDQ